MSSFEGQWQRWFPEDGNGKKPSEPGKRRWTAVRVLSILAGLIALFILLNVGKGFYSEWLWFDSLGYGSVYATILRTRVLVFFIAASIFCLFFLGNLMLAMQFMSQKKMTIDNPMAAMKLQKVFPLLK